jgi:predicted Zn-dependent peptidase
MKQLKYIVGCVLFTTSFSSNAQMGKAYEMDVNGVKVIVQPSGNEIVEVLTILKGGVQNYPEAKAGIENLALRALRECGTAKDDKNTFLNKLDKVSAQVGGSAGMDYASFRMNCIKTDFETVWPLYVDALTTPRFDPKEFERIKQDAITELKAAESNPDAAISRMARQLAFAGKNYSKDPQGTVESVSKLTAADTKAYYKGLLHRGRMTIVIVGDLDKEQLQEKIKGLLAKIPAGTPFKSVKQSFAATANNITPKEKELATNYIQGITGAPQPGTPEYNAFVLAMDIFSAKHFLEIRTKNGLSYAPGAGLRGGTTPYAAISVSTTDPDKYIAVARQLIDKIKKEGFKPEEVKNSKSKYVTRVFYQQETNTAQAASLASNEVVHGNWQRAIKLKDELNKVQVEDVNRVFNKYISNMVWAYQGDPKKVTAKLFTQKETPQLPTKTF